MSSNRFFKTLSVFFLVTANFSITSAATREELENKLYANSLELKSLESEVQAQENRKNSGYSSFMPSLNAVGGWAKNKTDEDDEKGMVGYLQGSANIFSGLSGLSQLNLEKQKLSLAQVNYELRKQALREELTEVLTSMISLHRLEKILDEEYKITQTQKVMAAKKVSAGLTSQVDNLEFELRESEIQIQRRNIAQLHDEAHQKLNSLFNAEIKDNELDSLEFRTLESLKQNRSAKHHQNHPENKKAIIEEEIAQSEKQGFTSELLPKLDLTYAFGRLTPSEEKLKYNESEVALTLTIPLFSGLDSYWKRKASVANVAAKELSKTQTQLNTKALFKRLNTKFSELMDLYQIYQKKAASSEKYYNLTLAEYKRGVKNSPDLVGATERYFDTKKKSIEIQKEIELLSVQLDQFN
ncbi:TolC family protein [Pseudobdellovibrio sp. HCB154]|uniref:TolC family protein n=1 Tax=Pseudobdellovibrio sp. HCB154 TaxID=3386277 RepID=UPI00391762EB